MRKSAIVSMLALLCAFAAYGQALLGFPPGTFTGRAAIDANGANINLLNGVTSTASACLSTRKVLAAYAGSALRVQRSSDSTQQDIGFTGGLLNIASLTAFVGGGTGYVVTWYDQCGGGYNFTSSPPAAPIIVSSGSLVTNSAGNPALSFASANRASLTSTATTGNVATASAWAAIGSFAATATTHLVSSTTAINAYDASVLLGDNPVGGNWNALGLGVLNSVLNAAAGDYDDAQTLLPISLNQTYVLYSQLSAGTLSASLNNTTPITNPAASNIDATGETLGIGVSGNGQFFDGILSEEITFSTVPPSGDITTLITGVGIIGGNMMQYAGASAFPAFLVSDGGTTPLIGVPTYPQSFYDATSSTQWLAWAGLTNPTTRQISVEINSGSGWSAETEVAPNPDVSDHGGPGIVMDQYGYVHFLYGTHDGTPWYTYTTTPRSIAAFATPTQPIAGCYTFFAPVLVSGLVYLFSTQTGSIPTCGSGTQDLFVQSATPSPAGGLTLWTAGELLTAFDPAFAAWIGNPIVFSNLICFPVTYVQEDTEQIQDVYEFCYNTIDGSVQNMAGTTIVPAISLPINQTTAQANFLVYSTPSPSTHSGIVPSQIVDGSGTLHIIFADGTVTNNVYALYETHWTGSLWSAPLSVGGTLYNFFQQAGVTISSDGGFDTYWSPDAASVSRVHWVSGSFGSPSTVLQKADPYFLAYGQSVFNGGTSAPINMLFGELVNFSNTTSIYPNVGIFGLKTPF